MEKIITKLSLFISRLLKLKINSSIGYLKQIKKDGEIGFSLPVIVRIIEFVLFLFVAVLTLILMIILMIIISGTILNINDSSAGSLISTGVAVFIISILRFAYVLFDQTASKVKIVKREKYIYLEGTIGLLTTEPTKNVKTNLNASILTIDFSQGFSFWVDLDTIEDEGLKKEFLGFLGIEG